MYFFSPHPLDPKGVPRFSEASFDTPFLIQGHESEMECQNWLQFSLPIFNNCVYVLTFRMPIPLRFFMLFKALSTTLLIHLRTASGMKKYFSWSLDGFNNFINFGTSPYIGMFIETVRSGLSTCNWTYPAEHNWFLTSWKRKWWFSINFPKTVKKFSLDLQN